MKKNKFLYILLLSVLFVACDKEDNLTPSNLGKDWFTIENSDDPVDRANLSILRGNGDSRVL